MLDPLPPSRIFTPVLSDVQKWVPRSVERIKMGCLFKLLYVVACPLCMLAARCAFWFSGMFVLCVTHVGGTCKQLVLAKKKKKHLNLRSNKKELSRNWVVN